MQAPVTSMAGESTAPLDAATGVRTAHIVVLVLCLLTNVLDGFDLQAMAFTSTRIMAEWAVDPAVMGLIFSAGLLGVGLGSFALSPFADRMGRRASIIAGLTVVTLGMLAMWAAASPVELTALRFLTGLGIGVLLPSLNTIVSEYAPLRWRSVAVSVYATGFPIGAALAGIIAPSLIAHRGWRWVYITGGAASLTLLPVVAAFLRESPEFLRKAVLARRVTERPHSFTPFESGLRRRTVLISVAFLSLWLTEFFINNWTPAILAREGLPAAQAAAAGVMLTVGGMVGTLLVGVFAVRFELAKVCVAFLSASFVLTVFFGLSGVQSTVMWVCAVLGFLLFGSAVGLYALVARVYPAEVRATGTGVALAFGRAGAMIGLSAGGYFISLGWPRGSYVSVLAIPLLAAAVATYALSAFVPVGEERS